MIITPTQIRVTEDRRQDLLAATARARLIAAVIQPSSSAAPQPVGRIRVSLRQAVASLAAFVAIG
jgi:hypothetical protein